MSTHVNAAPAPRAPVPGGEWLRISAAMGEEVVSLADRGDLTVHCAPGAGRGSPGCFLPALAAIELDGAHLGCDPATCDPSVPGDRTRYPALWGALVHEAAHAAHSRWDIPRIAGTAEAQAATLLEESRIEARQLTRRPVDRVWLRACARHLILADYTDAHGTVHLPADAWGAGHAAALLLARADAGVLEPREVAEVARAAESVLGARTLACLRGIWRAAHTAADTDTAAMMNLARRWCRLLKADPGQAPPRLTGPHAAPGASPVAAAVASAMEQVAATLPAPTAAQEEAGARRRAAHQADQVFASPASKAGSGGAAAPGNGSASTPDSPVGSTRVPEAAEQAAARQVARWLREASVRERPRTTVSSAVPPGRLRMRSVLAREAQLAAGAVPTAQPFTRTMRKRAPTPPLRLGIACDVSGSMAMFTDPVASAAWILARACTHLSDASSATVLFGREVTALTRPGRAPARVTGFRARDRRHQFTQAVDALEGALDLTTPGAARLLVIISDGHFEQQQIDEGPARLHRLAASGCAVLWLAPDTRGVYPLGPVHPVTLTDPATAPAVIGKAAAQALRNA